MLCLLFTFAFAAQEGYLYITGTLRFPSFSGPLYCVFIISLANLLRARILGP
jgi:hypothetical protein